MQKLILKLFNSILSLPPNMNMKIYAGLLLLFLFMISCGTSQKVVERNPYKKSVAKTEGLKSLQSHFSGKNTPKIIELLKDAEKYLGAPYKYAGNTSSGFDCSGFVCKVYDENDKKLGRRSADQALEGESIPERNIKPGDLVFFATAGGGTVSHVGIVHTINPDGEITFIHASTSKGVIISSLNEKYWNAAYLFARRVL